jgi:hypothetical protein
MFLRNGVNNEKRNDTAVRIYDNNKYDKNIKGKRLKMKAKAKANVRRGSGKQVTLTPLSFVSKNVTMKYNLDKRSP